MLQVRGLKKQYRDFVLEDISFVLPKGYIMGYVGQNGSGKTTTLSLIAHLRRADAGEVLIDGLCYRDDPVRYREAIGYVGDESYFYPEFRLADVRGILQDFYAAFDREMFDGLIQRWRLPEKKKMKEYSRGMRVKLMFACALARRTKLLILDEATNGLDPVVRAEVLELLQEYIADGEHSVLFSTHILSDLEKIADYIFFLRHGRKVFCRAKEELQEEFVLVKGGLEDMTDSMKRCMIGCKTSSVGFEALMKSDDAIYLTPGCLVEKPTIDEIVVHYISSGDAAAFADRAIRGGAWTGRGEGR